MKKITSFVLAIMMVITMSIPVMAANDTQETMALSDDTVEAVYATAYMVIDEETEEEQKAQILAAREEVIYSKSWVADGLSGRILDRDGNVKRVLPQFSDIFPEDWDLPITEESQGGLNSSETCGLEIMTVLPEFDVVQSFYGEVKLSAPSLPLTPPFCTIETTGWPGYTQEYYVETVYTNGVYKNLFEEGTFNVGYTDVSTGESLAFATYLENGDTFEFDPPENITLGVRASTYDRKGGWTMRVDSRRIFINA